MTGAAANVGAGDADRETTVRVRLFGPQARLVGQDVVSVSIAGKATAGATLKALEAFEALRPSLPGSRLAVNHEYAAADALIAAEDELALIGLVSGG